MWPFVFGIVYRRLRGVSGVAEDLSQDVFLKLFRARPFAKLQENPSAFRAYVARMAQNVTFTYLRHILRTQELEKSSDFRDEMKSQISEPEMPSNNIESKDAVQGITENLRPEENELFKLVVSGLSISEISKALGITYPAAAVRLHRLRKRLKK
jgi:RNA polymerase sigma factor (sigma-70 family)